MDSPSGYGKEEGGKGWASAIHRHGTDFIYANLIIIIFARVIQLAVYTGFSQHNTPSFYVIWSESPAFYEMENKSVQLFRLLINLST